MSKTYKTDPGWVKALRNNSPEISEYHDHRYSDCDIDEAVNDEVFWWRRSGHCGYGVSYYGWHNGFYSRPPRGQIYRHLEEGRMRAAWRKAKHDMLKLDSEGIEDYDVKTYQHRHSALWEIW